MEIIFIYLFGMGRGNGKRYKLSSVVVYGINKRFRIIIKNDDEFCCVRVIVIMKVRIDGGGFVDVYY